MPDWQKLVRARLGGLGLGPERDEEVLAELADHLEDLYEDPCWHGSSAEEAFQRALCEVSDGAEISRRIQRATREEDIVNDRIRSVWLPGLVTLSVSMGMLLLAIRTGLRPQIVWVSPGVPLLFYIPWLLALPVIGALGACWSRRAGGSLGSRIIAGVFPALALAGLFFFILPVGRVIDRHVPWAVVLPALAIGLLGWVVIPGAALLAGALPFLGGSSPDSSGDRGRVRIAG